MAITVRMESYEREEQEQLGSWDWVQLTGEHLRAAPDGRHIAVFDKSTGCWYAAPESGWPSWKCDIAWSDVIMG